MAGRSVPGNPRYRRWKQRGDVEAAALLRVLRRYAPTAEVFARGEFEHLTIWLDLEGAERLRIALAALSRR